jgi:hypothetical protein
LRQQSTIAASSPVDQKDAIPKETKQLEQVSQTQCAKTYSSDCGLWDKALVQLQESSKDKDIVAVVECFARSPVADNATPESKPSTVKGFAKVIKEKLKHEINSKEHDSETYRFVERTVSVLNKFLSVGDVVVNFDPIHADLPWAAVRFIFVVSSSVVCAAPLFLKSQANLYRLSPPAAG